MSSIIGTKSLFFLSLDGTYRAMGCEERDSSSPQFTDHCFTGEYPTPLVDIEQGKVSKQYSLLSDKSYSSLGTHSLLYRQ